MIDAAKLYFLTPTGFCKRLPENRRGKKLNQLKVFFSRDERKKLIILQQIKTLKRDGMMTGAQATVNNIYSSL